MLCRLCPNECNVDRSKTYGACRCRDEAVVARVAPHFYEEPVISGTRGSGAIFFVGCVMRCEFCQNFEISRDEGDYRHMSPKELADCMRDLEAAGCHNINLVTPTQYSHKIREALDLYRPSIPIVYNTSGYESVSVLREMEPYVDIYLTDYKYAFCETAERYSQRRKYPEVVEAATDEMIRQKATVIENGLMKSGVIIRHLILPGNIQNSLAVMEKMKKYPDAVISVMSQFTPTGNSTIKRGVSPLENKLVLARAEQLPNEYVFAQELSSCGKEYVPEWNLKNH